MTKYEAAVVTAYTQICIGSVSEYRKYAEKLLGRPLFEGDLADGQTIKEIREKSKKDFVSIKIRG